MLKISCQKCRQSIGVPTGIVGRKPRHKIVKEVWQKTLEKYIKLLLRGIPLYRRNVDFAKQLLLLILYKQDSLHYNLRFFNWKTLLILYSFASKYCGTRTISLYLLYNFYLFVSFQIIIDLQVELVLALAYFCLQQLHYIFTLNTLLTSLRGWVI